MAVEGKEDARRTDWRWRRAGLQHLQRGVGPVGTILKESRVGRMSKTLSSLHTEALVAHEMRIPERQETFRQSLYVEAWGQIGVIDGLARDLL